MGLYNEYIKEVKRDSKKDWNLLTSLILAVNTEISFRTQMMVLPFSQPFMSLLTF